MPLFSEDQVMALAPDQASAKSGRELSNPRKWVSHGANAQAVWGECQGSGAKPYQTCIDLRREPAFKCSCPSRKFPCKHGLGLLLMLATAGQQSLLDAPDWVMQWLNSRNERAEKKTQKDENEKQPPDPSKKAKTQTNRIAKVESGIQDFRLWLKDRMRQGLSGLDAESYQYWESSAARLTDAQAPGLARSLRQCAAIAGSGQGWQERLLDKLSTLHMAAEAFAKINELPEAMQHDLRTVIGFTVSQEELLQNERGIIDEWEVVGKRVELEDRLKIQRSWLRGRNTKRWALVLHFSHGTATLDLSLPPGFCFDGELVFFPGAYPLRALVKAKSGGMKAVNKFQIYNNIESFFLDYAEALAKNPWVESFPIALTEARLYPGEKNKVFLVDEDDAILPLRASRSLAYHMMALSGSHKISFFGEWNGSSVLPVSCIAEGKFHSLESRLVLDA